MDEQLVIQNIAQIQDIWRDNRQKGKAGMSENPKKPKAYEPGRTFKVNVLETLCTSEAFFFSKANSLGEIDLIDVQVVCSNIEHIAKQIQSRILQIRNDRQNNGFLPDDDRHTDFDQ